MGKDKNQTSKSGSGKGKEEVSTDQGSGKGKGKGGGGGGLKAANSINVRHILVCVNCISICIFYFLFHL